MKIIHKSDFRIIVRPRGLGDYGSIRISDSMFYKTEEAREKEYTNRCNEIMDEIKRHVDNVGRMDIEYDVEETCSHCNLAWELDELGIPVCCDKAIKEHHEQKQKA